MIIWITGLSGAGKSTIAREVLAHLKAQGIASVLLDGDEIRWAIQDGNIAHDRESRLVNAYRICRFAKLLERQDLVVVVATMSLFHEIHAWNRQHFQEYFEVFIDVQPETLQSRDARGLYSRLENGEVHHVVGFDLEVEKPMAPHLIFENNETCEDFKGIAQIIIHQCFATKTASKP